MHGISHTTSSTIGRATRVNIGKARRYQRREPGAPFSLGHLRECEMILKVVNHVFGETLPDDDFGREALFEVLNQYALNGVTPDELREHGLDLLPEVGDDDTIDDMVKAIGIGRKRKADDIARRFGVDYQMRTFLDLRTFGACDMTKAERAAIAAQKEAMDKRWKREKAGSKPQAESEARKKPWEAMNIGRTKYYALKKAEKEAAAATPNDTGEPVRRSYSSKFSLPKQSDPVDPDSEPPADPRPHLERQAPAYPQSPSHCQAASSLDPPEREVVVSEMPACKAAEPIPRSAATRITGLENVAPDIAFRNAHFERFQLIKAMPLDPKQHARFAELDAFIEAERERRALRRSLMASDRQGGAGASRSRQRMGDAAAGGGWTSGKENYG